MFSSAKQSAVRSTVSSSRAVAPRKNESFLTFLFRKVREMFSGLWGYSRRFLWVGTTAMIVLILPFAFAYFQQMQKQLLKMQIDGRANMM